MKRKRTQERPSLIPFDDLKYELTPHLVSNLTWAHRNAGTVSAMRFSHYGYKRLASDAHQRRIAYGIMRAGHTGATLDDVTRLLAGDLLPPRKRSVETMGRKVAVLMEAACGVGGEPSTPGFFATYLDFLAEGTTLWSRFVGRRKEKIIENHRASVKVSESVSRLYEWINDDELLATEPILRTATLYWGLSIIHPHTLQLPAIDAVVLHELRAGSIDRRGLLVLPDSEPGTQALRLDGGIMAKADHLGDLTQYFEHFTIELAQALVVLKNRLDRFQDQEDRLPWLMVSPPDELDRQIFDIIEQLGSARSQDILKELSEPPPLRTLQRRLQRLTKEGLIAKHGSRKFAYYRLAEHR